MRARILALLGAVLLALFIASCPLFHGVAAPNMLIQAFVWFLVLLMGAVATCLLYFAITGEGPL